MKESTTNASQNLTQKTASGVFWLFMERICAQLISFSISVILARLLLPEEYGLIAIVMVFINILNVFVTGSFSTSLVQKKDTDDLDYCSVFWFNLFTSCVVFALLFACAPLINRLYEYDRLIAVIRVMGLQIIIAGAKSVFSAKMTKQMMFKKFFWATFVGTGVSAVVSIYMAYHGFGVWALVAQYLINHSIDTLMLALVLKWLPRLQVSFSRLKRLVSFGWKVLASNLIDTVYNNLRSLIIGAKYSSADLAYYNRGKQFPELIMNNLVTSVNNAIFPALSQKQDRKETIKHMTRTTMKTTSYLVMPLMFGLALIAKPLVLTVLTEKWLPCVPFLQILCFNNALMPLQSANVQSILAMGRSDINVKLSIAKKSFGLAMILISSQISVLAMAVAGIITAVFCLLVNMFPNKKLFDYGIKEQLTDILPYVLLSGAMCVCVWPVRFLPIPSLLQAGLQVVLGATVYLLISLALRIDSFYFLFNLLRRLLHRPPLTPKPR